MVAPPNNQESRTSPLQAEAALSDNINRSTGRSRARRLHPDDGTQWRENSENTRPAGWTDNPAAAAASGRVASAGAGGAAAAGGRGGAGRGSVLGVLPSISVAGGPETDGDYGTPRAAGVTPLADRQQRQPLSASAAASVGMMNANEEVSRGLHSSRRSGVIRAEESKRATSDMELEMWKLGLQVGSKLDVKDTVDKWCEATVLAVNREAAEILVTYTYWSSKWDEWISIDAPFLAPPGTMVYQEGGPLRVGHRVEVLDEINQWLEAEVIETAEDGRALVHFKGFSKKFDTWMSPYGGRVRQYRPQRVANKGVTRSSGRQASLAPGQQHVRQIAQLSRRYEHYEHALSNHGLRVVPVEGDGNCLFRSVSHQIYGDDSHHKLVRARCMDYMESEAHFFEPYVEGDMAAFLRYLDVKRQNAVWGDDPEVQALCEIYDRPAEIWAYDSQLGAKTLRSFHEAAGGATNGSRRPPMRLSYYGGGHYDSVSPIDSPASSPGMVSPLRGQGAAVAEAAGGSGRPAGAAGAIAAGATLPIPEPGQLEDAALERSRRRAADAGSGRWDLAEMKLPKDDEDSSAGRAAMDYALALSRNVFEAQDDDLDSALVASVDHMEKSNLSSLQAASRDSELVVLQEEMLRSAQAQSEEDQLRNALEASRNTAAAAAAEADLVRQAIAESMGTGGGSGVGAGADGSCGAGAGAASGGSLEGGAGKGGATAPNKPSASGAIEGQGQQSKSPVKGVAAGAADALEEDEALKRVLLMSGMEDAWETLPAEAGGPARGFNSDYDLDDDAELRLAIEASLTGE